MDTITGTPNADIFLMCLSRFVIAPALTASTFSDSSSSLLGRYPPRLPMAPPCSFIDLIVTFITTQSSNWDGKLKATFGGGVRDDAHTVNAIQFFTNVGGGFSSATAKLYGVKQI